MNPEIEEKILAWIKQHGTVSSVFLQVKLKITFSEAQKYLEDVTNLLQNKSDTSLAQHD